MTKFFKKIYIIALICLVGCGYQPIFSSKNNSFEVIINSTSGDTNLNNIIIKKLESFKNQKNNTKKFEIEIETIANKTISSKDSKGDPKTFKTEVFAKLKITDEKNIKFVKEFVEFNIYNNNSKKFELKQYEDNIKDNLIEKISEDIIIYLLSI